MMWIVGGMYVIIDDKVTTACPLLQPPTPYNPPRRPRVAHPPFNQLNKRQ